MGIGVRGTRLGRHSAFAKEDGEHVVDSKGNRIR
jgi:hypothetical protein